MAGGVGSRFWPMSTPEKPKQFIDVLGIGKSLLQLTVERFMDVIHPQNIWVVTSKKYQAIVVEQIPQIPIEQILLEPCMRNTAPCIAYVTYKIRKKYPNANLVFSPADHIVMDTEQFKKVVTEALNFTNHTETIVTLGMKPTRPEIGYGYIKGGSEEDSIRKVEEFKEKPDKETAIRYIEDGNYFWNAGIFVWNANTVVKEFQKCVPALAEKFANLDSVYFTDKEQSIIDREFPSCESISIDYAIMEKSTQTYVLPASFGWSDLGTWGSLYMHMEKDMQENATVGNEVVLVDCENCMIHVPGEKTVMIEGLKDYIVAEKNGSMLICKKENEQAIKKWRGK